MIRAVTLQKHGFLDFNYRPAYFEDNDYYGRVVLGGGKCRVVYGAQFFHHGSMTVRQDAEMAHHVNYWFAKNRAYFSRKWGVAHPENSHEGVLRHYYRHPFNDVCMRGVICPMHVIPASFPPHGNYRELLSYRKAEIVYDRSYLLCHRFLARDIIQSGMRIVTAYEDGPTNAAYFSLRRGQQDGAAAHMYAQQIQQPANSAIYFTVDYDATTATTQDGITQYFRGVKDGLSTAAGGSPIYEVGVYGSGRVCRWIKEQRHLATYSWLAESTGWAESDTYTDPDIKQSIARLGNRGLFRAHRLDEYPPAPGDIIQNNRGGQN